MADSAPSAEELLEHTEWLMRLARALVGDSAAADVVQDTYESVLAGPSNRTGPLRPWLGGVARNVARMAARGRIRREHREQAVPVHEDVPSPEHLLARAQIQQKVNRLVVELPEPLRSTLLLRFFEGLSAAEIARAQGIPAATVRSRLKDALDRIRAALDAEHGNDRRAWAGLLAPLPVAAPHGTAATGKEVTIADGKDTDVGTLTVTAGRSISGRVIDEYGAPVTNATVAAGALLTTGGADQVYIKNESIAAKDTETDAQGRFVLQGFPPASLTVVAGKTNAGRSASVQLPPSSDSLALDLVLAATSELEGKVTRNGQPLADTVIFASPIGAMWSMFYVTSGPDGTFAFDALPPGSYVVYPRLGSGNAPGEMYMRRGEVVLGTRTKLDIDATPGPVSLTVSVKTDKGARLTMAQLGAIQLSINPHTAEELRDGAQMPTDRTVPMYGSGIHDGATSIENMRPGAYTLCAVLGDPRVASSVKLECTHMKLTAAAKQSASLVVPAAWLGGN